MYGICDKYITMQLNAPKYIVDELAFIKDRVRWMEAQPKDIDGALLDLDLVLEAGTLRRRIDELEYYLLHS